MKKIAFVIATTLIVSLSSCEKIEIPDINGGTGGGTTTTTPGVVVGQGAVVTKTINASGFDKIDLKLVSEVVYVQDAVFKVEVSAQQNIINIIDFKTDATNTLTVKTDSSFSTNKGIKIEIHSPSIFGLAVNGAGSISAAQAINTSLLNLKINGAGQINLDKLTVNDLTAKISGFGSINLKDGTAKTEELEVNGAGQIISDGLQSDKSKVVAKGTSTINVNAVNELDVTIEGVSTVNYKGNPTITKNISLLGKLNKI